MKSFTGENIFLSILIALAAVFYSSVIAPSVYLGDSGELSTASFVLGVAHTPGYPVSSILDKLFSLISPIGDIAFRANFFGAVCSVMTAVVLFSISKHFIKNEFVSFLTVLIFLSIPVYCSQIYAKEVYSLYFLCIFLIIHMILRIPQPDDKNATRNLYLLCFTLGIGIMIHYQTAMYVVPIIFYLFDHLRRSSSKKIFTCVFFGAVPFLIEIYLPIRSKLVEIMDWGTLSSFPNFIRSLLAQSHTSRVTGFFNAETTLSRVAEMGAHISQEIGIVLVILSAFGALVLFFRSKKNFFFLFAVIIADSVYALFINVVPFELTGFNIVSIFILILLAMLGISRAIGKIGNTNIRRFVFILVALFPLFYHTKNYFPNNQSYNWIGYHSAENSFITLGEYSSGSIYGDNQSFPFIYLYGVENYNPMPEISDSALQLLNDRQGRSMNNIENIYTRSLKKYGDRAFAFWMPLVDTHPYWLKHSTVVCMRPVNEVIEHIVEGDERKYWWNERVDLEAGNLYLDFDNQEILYGTLIDYSIFLIDNEHREKEAISILKKIERENPKIASILSSLVFVYEKLGAYDNAMHVLESMDEKEVVKTGVGYANIARIARDHYMDRKKALKYIDKALKIQRNNTEYQRFRNETIGKKK